MDSIDERGTNADRGVREKIGDAADWTRERASDLGQQLADKASDLSDQATRRARHARLGFWQTMEESPLRVGFMVLAIGFLVGLLIPATEPEDELMGDARDRLLDNVKDAGHQALDSLHAG